MKLRTRILLVGGLLQYGIAAALVAGLWGSWTAVILATGWLACGRSVLKRTVLPLLFPRTMCAHCKHAISLTRRWCCKDHYKDHQERHILAFHCNQGHELGSFGCPTEGCGATIQIRWGRMFRQGRPLESSMLSAPERGRRRFWHGESTSETRLLIGYDRRYVIGWFARMRRLLLGGSVKKPVWVHPEVFSRHTCFLGGTGMGKSTLIVNLAKQVFRQGEGATFLDPTGDLAEDLLKQVPPDRIDDVLYIDVSDRQFPFPFNLLHAHDEIERNLLVDEILDIFKRLYPKSWGDKLAHQLRMALNLVLAVGGSFQDVYDLFTSPDARDRIARKCKDGDLRRYWIEEFPSSSLANRLAVINKLAPIVEHPFLGPILCTHQCAFNADEIIRKRKIVIVNLATGSPADHTTTILGTFVVNKIIAGAYRQKSLPREQRIRHFFFVDEFQNFMHRASGFDRILSEARKYKLVLIIANQFVEQLKDELRAAIFGNVGCLTVFRVGHRDAKILKDEFDGASKRDLTALTLGECTVRIGTHAMSVRTPPPPPVSEADPTPLIIENMHKLIDPMRPNKSSQEEARHSQSTEVDDAPYEFELIPEFVQLAA